MENVKFNLKSFREDKLGMTQADFAELIGVRQDAISRMEKNPSQISVEILIVIAMKTGITLDQLVNYKKPTIKPLTIEHTWKDADFTKKTIVQYIENYSQSFSESAGSKYGKLIDELRITVNNTIRKPKIALVGRSDVGKSALINSLLGENAMPTAWTPTTSIVVYIKHISDRPSFINEDVWIFKAKNDGSCWDDMYLEDEKYCCDWKVASGTFDLLASYGTRQGNNYRDKEAGAAVIFTESEILKNCDILDLPGYGTGDRVEDDVMTINAKQKADILVYLSLANGFMRSEDMVYLREAITMLTPIENRERNTIEPLSNLFIVASQAHTVDGGNIDSLSLVLDKGCERFEKTITDNFWSGRKEITGFDYGHDILRSRFFAYSIDIEHVRKSFEKEMKYIVESLPQCIEGKAKEHIKAYSEKEGVSLTDEIRSYESMILEKGKYEDLLKAIEINEPVRKNDDQHHRADIKCAIDDYRKNSISAFSSQYRSIIAVDNIVEIIKRRDYKKKKEDIQLLAAYLNSILDEKFQTIVQGNSELLSKKIDAYIKTFEMDCQVSFKNGVMSDLNINLFDAKRAFASGLAGLATFGGLAVWASTLGNLGAYILLAKGVSLLSALGISVGGTAAAASAVAAIGGPIVLGLALAVIAFFGIFSIFSGGWETKLAKKIVNAYDEQNALGKYKNNGEKFWLETQSAFDAAADNLENEWQDYVKNIEGLINNYDVEDIRKRISLAQNLKDFFCNIPL